MQGCLGKYREVADHVNGRVSMQGPRHVWQNCQGYLCRHYVTCRYPHGVSVLSTRDTNDSVISPPHTSYETAQGWALADRTRHLYRWF